MTADRNVSSESQIDHNRDLPTLENTVQCTSKTNALNKPLQYFIKTCGVMLRNKGKQPALRVNKTYNGRAQI